MSDDVNWVPPSWKQGASPWWLEGYRTPWAIEGVRTVVVAPRPLNAMVDMDDEAICRSGRPATQMMD